jgi:hypothetical protein
MSLKAYTFAKNQVIDDYLFRTGLMGRFEDRDYLQKTDSITFYSDIDKLYKQYPVVNRTGICLNDKAELRRLGLIPGEKTNLGIFDENSAFLFLNEEEQEFIATGEIIANVSVGTYDADYIAYGTKDDGPQQCDLLPIYFELAGKTNYKIRPFVGRGHNFEEITVEGKHNFDNMRWKEAVDEFMLWCSFNISPQ